MAVVGFRFRGSDDFSAHIREIVAAEGRCEVSRLLLDNVIECVDVSARKMLDHVTALIRHKPTSLKLPEARTPEELVAQLAASIGCRSQIRPNNGNIVFWAGEE